MVSVQTLIHANAPGSGKGLLVATLSTILAGRPMACMAPSPSDAEEAKRITALLMTGATLALIDNVADSLGSASLDALLTASVWESRVLGSSRMVRLPVQLSLFATGNNIRLRGDTGRRTLAIRLTSPDENPERRTGFRYDPLLPWVAAQRSRLLTAALTLLRAYVVAGQPDQCLPAWGSYEGWSALVRGCLVWAGQPDPGATRLDLQGAGDDTTLALGDLLAGWEAIAAQFGGRCTAAQVHAVLTMDAGRQQHPHLWAALDELAPGGTGRLPTVRQIGNTLKRFRGRVVGGRVLEKSGTRGEAGIYWAVRPIAPVPSVITGPETTPASAVSGTGPSSEEATSTDPSGDGGHPAAA